MQSIVDSQWSIGKPSRRLCNQANMKMNFSRTMYVYEHSEVEKEERGTQRA
jgi:hypothetical protein